MQNQHPDAIETDSDHTIKGGEYNRYSTSREALALSPEESVWQSDPVRLSLERPLTVKYIDNKTFTALLTKGGAQKDLEQLSQEKFLEQF